MCENESTPTSVTPLSPVFPCPQPPSGLGEPTPENIDYGLTLPSAAATPTIAHEAAEVILDVHCLVDELVGPALLIVRQLVTYACQFTLPGQRVRLALGQATGGLRVSVYDTHAAHELPHVAAVCAKARRAALGRVPHLVATHHGTWGFDATHQPDIGTRTWATLVHVPRTWAVLDGR